MQILESEKTFFADVQQRAEKYVEDRILLFKLQSTEKIAAFSPKMILVICLAFTGFFILLIATVLLGYYLTIVTHSFFAGFGIMLAFYILVFVTIVVCYRKFFKKYIADMVVKMIFSNSNEEVEYGR